MELSEADYMKILEYVASKNDQKVVKHNGFIYIVSKDLVFDDDSYLMTYYSALTAKRYFDYAHAEVIAQPKYYLNSLWRLSPEELLIQADLDANE